MELLKTRCLCVICKEDLKPLTINGVAVSLCDLRESLDAEGLPSRCFSCMERPADMLLLPCQHLRLCYGCISRSGAKGCPTCGVQIQHKCVVKWPEEATTNTCEWTPVRESCRYGDDPELCLPPMFSEEPDLLFMRKRCTSQVKR